MGSHTPALGATVPDLLTRGDVARALGIPLRKLTWWVWVLAKHRRYTEFDLAKRDGSVRVIRAPIKPIKDIQRSLLELFSPVYDPPVHVHGFVSGKSPLSNAQEHVRQKWVLRVDIEDFFPTIHFGRVRGLFMKYPFDYPADVATLLAQICCHEGQLPQGAPTSPMISNLICRGMDRDLANLARAEHCRFTRYADDLCFSTDRYVFPSALASAGPSGVIQAGSALQQITHRHGFAISPHKTTLRKATGRQRVTGIVVNKKANIPADYVRSLRNLLYIWRTHGEDAAVQAFQRANVPRNRAPGRPDATFRGTVRGRLQYVGSIKGWSSPTYRRLALALQDLDDGFQPKTLLTLPAPQTVRIYTEGPSDPLHLVAALEYFHARGEFANLLLEVPDDVAAGGDKDLLVKCKGLALSPQAIPCICLFDRDDPSMVAKAVGAANAKDYLNSVAAVAISAPDWRESRVCVEMLYKDDDLRRRDSNGRRLYLNEEFNERTGQHESEDVHVSHPGGRTLVREEVFRFGSDDNVALSKMDFARAVSAEAEGFDGVEFEGFRKTFEIITETVSRLVARPTST